MDHAAYGIGMKVSVALSIPVVIFGFSVYADESATGSSKVSSLFGAEVEPLQNLPVYSGKPSVWFGNLFNEEVGELTPDDSLKVVNIAQYATPTSPNVWVELVSVSSDSNAPCAEGCWAYLGQSDKLATLFSNDAKLGNFQLSIEGENGRSVGN